MFKKKTPEVPRARTRVVQQAPQNTVFSYHASRAGSSDPRGRQMPTEEVPKRVKRPPKWLRAKNILNVVVIFIVFLLLVGLSSTPKIVITGDDASKTFVRDPIVYQAAARKLFGASTFNANKLTINTATVARGLKEQFPELRTVSISLPVIGRQPTVYVQPATPQLILQSNGGTQYMLDSNGRALATVTPSAKLPTGKEALPIVTDQSGLPLKVGDVALPSGSVSFITEVSGQLHAKNLRIASWTLPAGTSELNVKVEGASYYVKFNLRGKAREQAGSFIATKQRLEGQNAVPKEYIDVRVSGRVYYK